MSEDKVNPKPLYDIQRASRYAAKVILPEGAKDTQVGIVAEKIAITAMGQAIGKGEFRLPDRPQSHVERVEQAEAAKPPRDVGI